MNWLESLLWDPSSVAHIVCLYAFVISVGVLLGKIKIFGVSLGVTFVLFAGILMGHFGFTGETHILHFIREFGLILFVFCIGLQVGYGEQALGIGQMTDIADIIYVKSEAFDSLSTEKIAEELLTLNNRMRDQGRPYILVGPGRWGSSDPFLGVPVK